MAEQEPKSALLSVVSERFGDELCGVLVNAALTEEKSMAEAGLLQHNNKHAMQQVGPQTREGGRQGGGLGMTVEVAVV